MGERGLGKAYPARGRTCDRNVALRHHAAALMTEHGNG